MKNFNYLLISLIIFVICGCQKNEFVNSNNDGNLPKELVELQKKYGVKISKSTSSRSSDIKASSLEEIKEGLDILMALCRDTIVLKSELSNQDISSAKPLSSTSSGGETYFSYDEYLVNPQEGDFRGSYIKVDVKLTAYYSQLMFEVHLTAKNLNYQTMKYTDMLYNSLSKGYDLNGGIRVVYSYYFQSLGVSYIIDADFAVLGSLDGGGIVYLNFVPLYMNYL